MIEYSSITIGKNNKMTIESIDRDGDVEIHIENQHAQDPDIYFYIKKGEAEKIINHLKTQFDL